LKDVFIVDKEEVDDAKNMYNEDSSFKNKNKKQKSHNFNQNPKRFFSTFVSMAMFICKKMRFVCFCTWMLACVVYVCNMQAFYSG
jgi:hypothetical protein